MVILFSVLCFNLLTMASTSILVKEVRPVFGPDNQIERCISCHTPEIHPQVPGHDILSEACTPCHNGMGRGITVQTAHYSDDFPKAKNRSGSLSFLIQNPKIGAPSPDALFAVDDVSAGCLRCHPPQTLDKEAASVSGWSLFTEKGCGRCHLVDLISAGRMGPELTQIGDIKSKQTIMEQVKTPQETGPYTRMPRYHLPEKEIEKITVFLKGQSKLYLRPSEYKVVQPFTENTLERFSCRGCHSFERTGLSTGPDLTDLKQMRSSDWIQRFVQEPAAFRPGARMPALKKTDSVALTTEDILGLKQIPPKGSTIRERYELLCARCHGEKGDGMGGIGLNLTAFPRLFSLNAGYFRLSARDKLKTSVENGIPGTAMPPFKNVLSEVEIDDSLDEIESRFVQIPPNDKVTDIPVPKKAKPLKKSAIILYDSLCARCHGVKGDRAVQTVHNRYPQPRNLRNTAYISAVSDNHLFRVISRGVPGTRMKAYKVAVPGTNVRTKETLKNEDIWSLVDQVRKLNTDE